MLSQPKPAAADPVAELLATIAALLAETQTQYGQSSLTLDSHLERDLGLDSLGRSELLLRLERQFNCRLAEHLLNAETPRELLHAVQSGQGVAQPLRPEDVQLLVVADTGVATPSQARTLLDVLDFHADRQPERTAIYLYQDSSQARAQAISYAELRANARAVAAGLRAQGVEPGQTVAIMLPTELAYFASFFGILLAGATPVPIYPPVRPSQLEDHLRRHARILDNAQAVLLITISEAKVVARLLRAQAPSLRTIMTVDELRQATDIWANPPVQAHDVAFLQYTSGSTGDPKGVMLSHANLLANIRAMVQRVEANAEDVFVSWLPLYHDMGLIGACLGSLYVGMPLAVMSPLSFLRRPASWLWALHRHRGTLSAAPNFAYELCLRNLQDDALEGLDLSSVRMLFNGAEPVSPATMRRFAERFAPYGLNPDALTPVYGLAECSVGLALANSGRGLKVDTIARDAFMRRGLAEPVPVDSAEADASLEIPACGHALAGHEIRIVDEGGRELPERREGRLQFRGPSATQGYLRNPEASEQLFDGDWLNSGDRAYIAEGDVYISGRVKDLIIRGGRNIYPYELEQAVGAISGIRKGCVAVFASTDLKTGTERLVVVAETRETEASTLEQLREKIRQQASDLLAAPPDNTVLVPPHTVLKTSSGKIRRNAVRELYEQNRLGKTAQPVWLQLSRLALSSVMPETKRILRRAGELLYGAYAWSWLGLLAAVLWLAIMILPKQAWRWAACRTGAKLLAKLTGFRISIEGLENLPSQACIVVANHTSYLDSLILTAALPRGFRYIAKGELANNFPLKLALERLGILFVERLDQTRSAVEGEKIVQAARAGDSLLFFPEGTFTRSPGLLPFRMGAFVTAAQAGVSVVPITLRGVRSLLRAESWLPRPGKVRINIDAPIFPSGDDWQAAATLRSQVRTVMLARSGEPDLGLEDSPYSNGRLEAARKTTDAEQ